MDNWGSMDHRGSMNHWGSNHRGMVGRASNSSYRDSLGVGSSAFIGHISNISVDGVGVVVDMLDPAVRESHRVGSLSIASSITGLSSIEVGVGVVIGNSVVVGVRRDLISINLSNSMGNWSMVSRGSNHGSMVSRGSMGNDWGMGHNTCHTASMGNVGVVRDSSHGGAESLGLDSCPVLSLERLRDRLVRGLTSSNSNNG